MQNSQKQTATQPVETRQPAQSSFAEFLERYKTTIKRHFDLQSAPAAAPATAYGERDSSQPNNDPHGTLSRESLDEILRERPLSVYIPKEYGGRGGYISEGLSMLEVSSYESLALSLTMGINGALFLQPLSRYGRPEVQSRIFNDFLERSVLGGLMITEPEYGSDALGMQTSFSPQGNGYHIRGTKHWGGLTGRADYWLLTARPQDERGELGRGLGMFVWEREASGINVEEFYPSLGLPIIPYGRNRIDTVVPEENRLTSSSTGLRMLLDTLHRSRLQFPGMAMGYLRRLADDAISHTRSRTVGGHPLIGYDQVRERIAVLQAYVTSCAAMCLKTTRLAGTDRDTSSLSLAANSIKTVVTDMMQSAAQSVMQLFGAKGYRRDHIAGRSLVDSRPFQIFEGSNDILYQQISEAVLKAMQKGRETNLYRYLSGLEGTSRAADRLRSVLDFQIDLKQPQRKLVQLGQALGQIMSVDMVLELADQGYREDLTRNAVNVLSSQIQNIVSGFTHNASVDVVEDSNDAPSWLQFAAE